MEFGTEFVPFTAGQAPCTLVASEGHEYLVPFFCVVLGKTANLLVEKAEMIFLVGAERSVCDGQCSQLDK